MAYDHFTYGNNNYYYETQGGLVFNYNYFERRGNWGKQNFCNGFSGLYAKGHGCVMWFYYTDDTQTLYHSANNYTSAVFVQNIWTSNDENALINELGDAIKQHHFNQSVALAEVDKTLRMIGKTGTDFQRSLHALDLKRQNEAYEILRENLRAKNLRDSRKLKKGFDPDYLKDPYSNKMWEEKIKGYKKKANRKRKGKKSMPGFISEQWLALVYGWVPLLEDVFSGAEALASMSPEVTTSSTKSISVSKKKTVTQKDYRSEREITIVKYLTVPITSTRAGRKGLDTSSTSSKLIDPLQVAWERVPYSFVVDWFVPYGDYLAAVDISNTYITGPVCQGVKTTDKSHGLDYTINGPTRDTVYKGNNWKHKGVTFVRSNSSISAQLPVLKPIDKIFSMRHILNGVALLFVPKSALKY